MLFTYDQVNFRNWGVWVQKFSDHALIEWNLSKLWHRIHGKLVRWQSKARFKEKLWNIFEN